MSSRFLRCQRCLHFQTQGWHSRSILPPGLTALPTMPGKGLYSSGSVLAGLSLLLDTYPPTALARARRRHWGLRYPSPSVSARECPRLQASHPEQSLNKNSISTRPVPTPWLRSRPRDIATLRTPARGPALPTAPGWLARVPPGRRLRLWRYAAPGPAAPNCVPRW